MDPVHVIAAADELRKPFGGLLCIGLVILFVYLLPTTIAMIRGHHNTFAIMLLNVLLGWTFVGWVVSLVWSVTAIERRD